MPNERQFSIVALKPPGENRSSGGPEPVTSKRVVIPSQTAVAINPP